MGEDPDRIRAEIEQTRAEMGETVDALGYKTDVKARAKDSIQDKKESVMGVASSAKERLVGAGQTVGDKTPDTEQVKGQAKRAASVAQQNPLGLAVGAVAVGFLAGMLVPATRVEDEKMGDLSDSVIEKAKETGQEALEHGKQVAQEAAQSAQETMKESGQEHAQQVKDSAQESAQDVKQEAQSSSGSPTYQTH
jgi:gas vesicle protein